MSQNKTTRNNQSVVDFITSIDNEIRKKDSLQLLEILKNLTHEEPKMWGSSIVGFGNYHYKYESGREGDFFRTGFSPRKQALTLYIMSGFNQYDQLLASLGSHKTGKSCLYIKSLQQVDIKILKEMITLSLKWMREKYPESDKYTS